MRHLNLILIKDGSLVLWERLHIRGSLFAFMYLFVLLMIYIKSEFSIFMYIYFKNFVLLFLVSAYISQG